MKIRIVELTLKFEVSDNKLRGMMKTEDLESARCDFINFIEEEDSDTSSSYDVLIDTSELHSKWQDTLSPNTSKIEQLER